MIVEKEELLKENLKLYNEFMNSLENADNN